MRSRRSASCTTRPSTGCLSPIAEIRKAIDAAGHPAFVLRRHHLVARLGRLSPRRVGRRRDHWRRSEGPDAAARHVIQRAERNKALAAAKTSMLPKSFWAWDDMLNMNKIGFFPYTPATQMLHGLATSIEMLHEEGLANVFARHDRLAEGDAARCARLGARDHVPRSRKYYSPTITAVMLPDGPMPTPSATWRSTVSTFPTGRASAAIPEIFPDRHLGDINETHLMGALGATEMGLALAGVRTRRAACRPRWTIWSPPTAAARAQRRSSVWSAPFARVWGLATCASARRAKMLLEEIDSQPQRPVGLRLAVGLAAMPREAWSAPGVFVNGDQRIR